MSPRLYEVRTTPTRAGFFVWCVQHRATALHPDRDVAVGMVVFAIALSAVRHASCASIRFHIESHSVSILGEACAPDSHMRNSVASP